MLAGLVTQGLTLDGGDAAWAFAVAALAFVALLVVASITVATASGDTIRQLRMTGPAVKRWGGWVLVAVGGWFVMLAVISSPILV